MTTTTGRAIVAKGGGRTDVKSAGNHRGLKTVVPIRNATAATRPHRAERRSGVPPLVRGASAAGGGEWEEMGFAVIRVSFVVIRIERIWNHEWNE
jgi:hypothetical protein